MNSRRVVASSSFVAAAQANYNPDSLDACAPASMRASRQTKLGMPGQRSSATPTRSAYENERILRFQTLCRTLADVAEWPTNLDIQPAETRIPACVGQARCTPREKEDARERGPRIPRRGSCRAKKFHGASQDANTAGRSLAPRVRTPVLARAGDGTGQTSAPGHLP